MSKPSMKKAEWIAARMPYETDPDDVYDVLLGNITETSSFVVDVQSNSIEYDEELRRNNARFNIRD